MASAGYWIGYSFFAFLSGFVFAFAIKEKVKYRKFILFIVSLAGYVSSVYLSASETTSINAFNCPEKTWICVIIAALIFGIISYVGYIYGKRNNDYRVLIAILILVVFMLIYLIPITQIIKVVTRRPRFRITIDSSYGYSAYFTNWWEPFKDYAAMKEANPTAISFSEQFKSFPSGHVGVAAILIFVLPYLSLIEPKLKNKETLLFIIGVIYTLIMALSRIIMGAHYLTDVCFSGLFMTTFFIFANEININVILKEKENLE